jgi:hypothetical protein
MSECAALRLETAVPACIAAADVQDPLPASRNADHDLGSTALVAHAVRPGEGG